MTSAELKELITRRYNPDHLVNMSHEAVMAYAQLVTAYHLALANERTPLYNYSWPNPPSSGWPTTYPLQPSVQPPIYPLGRTITCKLPFATGMTTVPVTIATTPSSANVACQVDDQSN